MLGNFPPRRFLPKFVKQYGDVWSEAHKAITQYKDETKSRAYPGKQFSYEIKKEELSKFEEAVEKRFGSEEAKSSENEQGLGATAIPK